MGIERRCRCRNIFLFLILCGFFISGDTGYCQAIESIIVDFKRVCIEEAKEETTKGIIYFEKPHTTTLKVTYPVQQWLVYKGNELKLYYPESNKAFLIHSQNPLSLPFFNAFIGVVRDDYGLSEIGYSMDSYETIQDTLISYWSPPKKLKKLFGQFTLKYYKDKIVYIESRYADDKLMSISHYKNHIKYGSTFFPLEITTSQYTNEKDSTYEKVLYSNVKFNPQLPEEVKSFTIPSDADIKEVQW